jgi:hypothetical protein
MGLGALGAACFFAATASLEPTAEMQPALTNAALINQYPCFMLTAPT